MKKSSASSMTQLAIFIAIMIVVQVVTQIVYGFWPSPIQPTFMQIPVMVGSIVLGPKKGAFLGFVMGLYSFVYSTIFPIASSYLFTPFQPGGSFWSLFIAFVPRILIGVFPYFVYKAIAKHGNSHFAGAIAGLVGNATNGILVLGSIFVFTNLHWLGSGLGQSFAAFIAGIITWNSAIEYPASIILTAAIAPVLKKIRN